MPDTITPQPTPAPEAEQPAAPATDSAAPAPAPTAAPRNGWLAIGIGSAALVGALLYATRSQRRDWTK